MKGLLRSGAALAVLVGVGLFAAAADAHHQHGELTGHLIGPGAFGNIELLSVEEVTQTPGLVADVAVSPNGQWAFLANWGEPDCAGPEVGGQTSPDAGAWVIDISDLQDPKTVGFIAAHQDSRPGEGMQVVNITTRHFSGDVLVMNNEQCGKNGKGGVSLWNVTNPHKPFKLSEHFGDRGGISPGDANDIHSSFAWDAGDRAYVVIVDNFETTDVDILDITNPRRPRLIRELSVDEDEEFPEIVQENPPNLDQIFLHDMVVKEIGGKFILLLSYWDGGYVQLDVTDPANPTLVGDTDYNDPDPQLLEATGASLPPEGNGHQNEFTSDSRFFLGTDEDFSPYALTFEVTDGPLAGQLFPAGEFGWTVPIALLPDGILNGPTVFGGYGCPDDRGTIPDATTVFPTVGADEERIIVFQRGPVQDPNSTQAACFFSEKVESGQLAGYDAVIIANHHVGASGGDHPDATLCGGQGHDFTVTAHGVCIGHRWMHLAFGRPEDYTIPYPSGDPSDVEPDIGDLGPRVQATFEFDGWGYVHLFSNTKVEVSPGVFKFPELDTYAIDEGHDEAFATGFGDLTVHEVATDPQDASRAYLSYYAGGLRSLQIQCADPADETTCELVEVGGYLDPLGNNFWGVEAFVRDGQTIILGSDRDSGLWIFRRTGS